MPGAWGRSWGLPPAPAVPVLTVADAADGTGGTATIAGSSAAAVNTVRVQAVGSSTWSTAGTRTGDGAVSLTLAKGGWWIKVDSALNGQSAASNVAYLLVTDAADSVSRSAVIAQAWASWLNDPLRAWPPIGASWTASRVQVPRANLKDLGGALLVEVVPLGQLDQGLLDRSRRQLDWLVGLSVRQHYDSGGAVSDSWLKARVALVEAIARQTREILPPAASLSGQPSGYTVWAESVVFDERIYDLESLDIDRVFSAQLIATFREAGPR